MRIEKPCEGEGSAVLMTDTEAGRNIMKAYDGHAIIGGLRRKGERRDDVNMRTTSSCISRRGNHPKMWKNTE